MLKHNGTQTIKTERLILRKFDYTDDDDMLKYWVSDPLIQLLYSEPIYLNKVEVSELLIKYISSYEKPNYYRWAIILEETKECIGQIAFFLVDSKNQFGEIEYCIGSNFQKKGIATEAIKAVIQFGFKSINFHKIQVCHKEGNIASKRAIEKCCFKYEGTLRDFFYMNGKYVDRLYYSLLKEEFNDYIKELST